MVWPSAGGREEGKARFQIREAEIVAPATVSDRTEKTKFLLFVQAEFLVSRKTEGKSCVIQRVDASSPPTPQLGGWLQENGDESHQPSHS